MSTGRKNLFQNKVDSQRQCAEFKLMQTQSEGVLCCYHHIEIHKSEIYKPETAFVYFRILVKSVAGNKLNHET